MKDQDTKKKGEPESGDKPKEKGAATDSPHEPLVNLRELKELIALLKKNGLTEFELEREGFRIHLRQGFDYPSPEQLPVAVPAKTAAPVSPSLNPPHPGASAQTAASEDQDLHIIESPIVGTFYRARSPNAEPFVKVGSTVEPDAIVCIIEAMKLMNEIQSETSGEVVKIYVENGQPVEYGQPLFGIKQ
jgi:acetyl-CoA carboxylase biotin carboxyl carrier protein